jgi:hypothetical protein
MPASAQALMTICHLCGMSIIAYFLLGATHSYGLNRGRRLIQQSLNTLARQWFQ